MEKVKLMEGLRVNSAERKKINLEFSIKSSGGIFEGHTVWKSCPKCGKQRWVRPNKQESLCIKCSRESKRKWIKGYEILSNNEYFEKFGKKKNGSMINFPCEKCGEKHWIELGDLKKKTNKKICRICFNKYMSETRGEDRWNYNKNYRIKNKLGYIIIRLKYNDPFISMANKNSNEILEHRYIMAKYIGRPLARYEIVHHVNCIKDDNRIENLTLVTLKDHNGKIICPHCGKTYIIQ